MTPTSAIDNLQFLKTLTASTMRNYYDNDPEMVPLAAAHMYLLKQIKALTTQTEDATV